MKNNLTLKHLVLTLLVFFFGHLVYAQTDTSENVLVNNILSLCERVENDPNLQSNHFNPGDTSSLPIGIVKQVGNSIIIICIDSAKYTPQGAFFNAYMAMDFPGSDRKIAFQAKNIQFNPQGVIGGSGARLQLASEQLINLGPNAQMIFKADGYNFIEWDCNGYNQAGLSIDFVFNPNILIHATNPSSPVKASFRTVIDDFKNLSISIPSMDPFRVKGAEEFSFSLTNIIIDRSELSNPPGLMLPSQTTQLYNGDINLWRGFFAQNITVTLPEKLSPEGQNTTIYANNLVIDDAGVSGTFGGTNILNIGSGNMSGWGFSIQDLSVQLTCNQLTGGSLSGGVRIPIMDNQEFNYTASITQNQQTNILDYLFIIQPSSTISYEIPCLSSTVKLEPTSLFEVRTINNKFVPKAILNGQWSWGNSKGSIQGIQFQTVTLVAEAPFITQGTFSLTSSSGGEKKMMRFPIALNQFGFALTQDNKLKIFVQLSLNLGEGSNSFSCSTGLNIITRTSTNSNGNLGLEFDRIGIDNILVSLNTTAFYLNGVIVVRNDDPVFGDLFYGAIDFRIKSIMQNNLNVAVGFGKMPEYKYWFVEVGVPVNIQITNTISLKKIFGGIQNRVRSVETESQIMARVLGGAPITPNLSNPIPFVPDAGYGLSFRAGVAFQNTLKEDVLNGEAMFSISFNSNGGLASVSLNGSAYMLCKREQRNLPDVKKVYGQISVNYDNTNKVFDAQLNGGVVVPNVLMGSVAVTIHVDSSDWYFWINRPSNRAYVSVLNLFTLNMYFMVGTQIDPIPPPPSAVTQLLGAGQFAGMDLAAISTGDGFATGAMLTAGVNKQIHLVGNWHGYVDASCGAGFDLTMFRLSETAHCVGSTEQVGINRWYLMGQVYGYVNAGLGVRKIVDGEIRQNITLIGLSSAFLMQGRLPKPTYITGALAVQFQFLTFNFGVTAQVSFGNDCQIVTN